MRERHIILLGHRKQHGKDTVGNIMETALTALGANVHKTMFVRLMKQNIADRYNLDFKKMDGDDYKNSRPPHLNGLSVRDVMIREGTFGRSIWEPVWANSAYREIMLSPNYPDVGIITDFRFPNEYLRHREIFSAMGFTEDLPKIHKVLVHRPDGPMVNDGCDAELPDLEGAKENGGDVWDFVIMNDCQTSHWRPRLNEQVEEFMNKFILR